LYNLQKKGKYGKEIGEKSVKLSTKIGEKIGTFTESVLTLQPPLGEPVHEYMNNTNNQKFQKFTKRIAITKLHTLFFGEQ